MNNLNKAAMVVTAILALGPLTAAADNGFYVGASVGSATFKDDLSGFEIDTSSNALRVVAGWQFNEYITIEGGYNNFGDFEKRVDNAGTPADLSLKVDGFTVGVTGFIPLPKSFSLFGRAGAFVWNGESKFNGLSQAKTDDTNPYYGGGLRYVINEHVSLLGDWTLYELDDSKSEVFALGFTYRF